MKAKEKKVKEEVIAKPKSNPKIEEIIKDYPQQLTAHPRGSFEDQLRKHLLKHNIK